MSDDGIPLGSGRWMPDDDSGSDRQAMEAGVASYSDLADLREFLTELDDVQGGWDIEVIVALREPARSMSAGDRTRSGRSRLVTLTRTSVTAARSRTERHRPRVV